MAEPTSTVLVEKGHWKRWLIVDPQPLECAGALLARAMEERLSMLPEVRLAIPGGSALGAASIAAGRLGEDWGRVKLTWVDERCVPVADAESNRGAAERLGLVASEGACVEGGIPKPSYVLPLFEEGETAAQAIARVEEAFEREFEGALDLVLLGMGADGHVASLFPSRPMPTEGIVVAIDDSPKPPAERITLTRAVLGTAATTILVATGEEKRDAITRLVGGDPELPAHRLALLHVVTDLDLDLDLEFEFEHEGKSEPEPMTGLTEKAD